MAHRNPIKRIFDLYTSDLSYQEIEKLIKQEASEVYEFFKSDIPKPDSSKNKFIRGLIFLRSLFNAFILRLSPARRIFYLIALFFFIVSYSEPNSLYLLLSFIILNLLLAFELADKLTAKSELEIARKIQFDLIPKHSPQIKDYQISTYYEPAREVGGDYFDVIETKEKSYIIVGDISGKGMAAALYMVRVQSIIYFLLDYYSDIKDIIINLKKYFSKNLRKEFFLTISILSIEKDGKINFVKGGHPPALLYKNNQKEFIEINPSGIAIGMNDRGLFEKTLAEIQINPDLNDIIIIYSDGVTETMNIFKNFFGLENIKKVVEKNVDKSAEEIKEALLKSIISFRGNAPQNDDLTLVVIKRNHSVSST
ncbi:MAG: PP2C family protein-serine/threonine phosphatase [Melioribacter sp.]|uniref:PP2C family protein-serine/threonine phosphatase n=1 Tax=Rosettibacter primus TaxID=3111523 RepID=UPI00247CEF3A|nr:PP2C family protein-serine/threonine phosphatase [Melioribacter sp.]